MKGHILPCASVLRFETLKSLWLGADLFVLRAVFWRFVEKLKFLRRCGGGRERDAQNFDPLTMFVRGRPSLVSAGLCAHVHAYLTLKLNSSRTRFGTVNKETIK